MTPWSLTPPGQMSAISQPSFAVAGAGGAEDRAALRIGDGLDDFVGGGLGGPVQDLGVGDPGVVNPVPVTPVVTVLAGKLVALAGVDAGRDRDHIYRLLVRTWENSGVE